jgi:hypothetical protein
MISKTKPFDRTEQMRAIAVIGRAAKARNLALRKLSAALADVRRTGAVPDEGTAEMLRKLLERAS